MLQLHTPSALEAGLVEIRGEAKRIPEADRLLNAKLSGWAERGLERRATVAAEESQRGVSIQSPITPSGTSEAILSN